MEAPEGVDDGGTWEFKENHLDDKAFLSNDMDQKLLLPRFVKAGFNMNFQVDWGNNTQLQPAEKEGPAALQDQPVPESPHVASSSSVEEKKPTEAPKKRKLLTAGSSPLPDPASQAIKRGKS